MEPVASEVLLEANTNFLLPDTDGVNGDRRSNSGYFIDSPSPILILYHFDCTWHFVDKFASDIIDSLFPQVIIKLLLLCAFPSEGNEMLTRYTESFKFEDVTPPPPTA